MRKFVMILLVSVICMSAAAAQEGLVERYPDVPPPRDYEIARFGRGRALSLDWRPDGMLLAVSSTTGVWLFNRAFEPIAQHLDALNRTPQEVKWSVNGDTLAVVMSDSTLHLWRIDALGHVQPDESRFNILVVRDHWYYHREIRWKPDGTQLSLNGLIVDTATGRTTAEFTRYQSVAWEKSYRERPTADVTWSPDGRRVVALRAVTTDPLMWAIYDAETRRRLVDLDTYTYWWNLAWSADGRYLTNGGMIWDTHTGELLNTPVAGTGVSTVLWLGDTIVSRNNSELGEPSSVLSVVDARTGLLRWRFDFELRLIDIAAMPDQPNRLYALTTQGVILTIDLATGRILDNTILFGGAFHTWSPDSDHLLMIYGGDEAVVQRWSVDDPDQPPELLGGTLYSADFITRGAIQPCVTDVRWRSPRLLSLVSVDCDSLDAISNHPWRVTLRDWNLQTDQPADERVVLATNDRMQMILNPDASLYVGMPPFLPDTYVPEVRSVFNTAYVLTLPEVPAPYKAQWSPNGRFILIMGYANAYLASAATGEIRTQFESTVDDYLTAQFSPNSRWLALVRLNSIEVIRLDTPEVVHTVSDRRASVAWHPNSRWLAVVDQNTLSVRDVATGITVFWANVSEPVTAPQWSPDGRSLSLLDEVGVIRVWSLGDALPPQP